MKETICLQGRLVTYELTRKAVKNINIRVRADGSVGVSAGRQVPQGEIESILQQKAAFLLQALDHFAAQPVRPDPGDYGPGAVVYLLGKPHGVVLAQGMHNGVEETEENVILTVKDPQDPVLRTKTMEAFLSRRCLEVTEQLCRHIQPAMVPLGVPLPEIKVRSMTSRWGTCKPSAGRITFARQLVGAPLVCVEYVVCHELVHFLHPNHSKAFYTCLAAFLPDWKARRQRLNSFGDW